MSSSCFSYVFFFSRFRRVLLIKLTLFRLVQFSSFKSSCVVLKLLCRYQVCLHYCQTEEENQLYNDAILIESRETLERV